MVTIMHRTTADLAATNGSGSDHDERLAYSVPAAAKLIGISARRVWDMVRTKKIRSFKDEGRRLISRRALEEYVAGREAAAQEEDVA